MYCTQYSISQGVKESKQELSHFAFSRSRIKIMRILDDLPLEEEVEVVCEAHVGVDGDDLPVRAHVHAVESISPAHKNLIVKLINLLIDIK
jgi:hypothetical protein